MGSIKRLINQKGNDMQRRHPPFGFVTYQESSMFGIESLDVMIGIVTIYLIFALACTAIVEALWFDILSRVMQVRAAGLSPRDKKKGEVPK